MKRLFALLSATVALTFAMPASASISYDLNLPGIGSQIPLLSYSLNLGTQDLDVVRDIDVFSPLLSNAATAGTVFSTGGFDIYDSSFSATIPLESFVMTGILITAFTSSGGTTATESVTLQYDTGRLVSNSVPEPSSLLLCAGAALALIGSMRRRRSV